MLQLSKIRFGFCIGYAALLGAHTTMCSLVGAQAVDCVAIACGLTFLGYHFFIKTPRDSV